MEKCDLIDFSALEKEMKRAVEADKKYQRENDAKFRAIHQKVATYEEFRDIVKASHLKPLDKKDKNAPRKQPWNPISTGNTELKHTGADSLECVLCELQPRSASEFVRDWRRFKGSSVEKYTFLLRLGGEKLREMFHIEVDVGLLGEFLMVLCQCFRSGDEAAVIGVLEGLSLTGHFGLGVSMLSEEERQACERLFSNLLETHPNLAEAPESQKERCAECETQTQENTAQDDGTEAAGKLRGLMEKYGVYGNAK
ncbi:coiled-coil domain-containing protein 103-like [Neoarius graeffei]|uniref:coiled-coil domain-containing protein 103-like n=1 Tax=Neoarius graeffei TaxID=443677 RepID=UPI00298D57CB|nr:coiled-coil domain-containing protein 103-like [Neoarius graeffei]